MRGSLRGLHALMHATSCILLPGSQEEKEGTGRTVLPSWTEFHHVVPGVAGLVRSPGTDMALFLGGVCRMGGNIFVFKSLRTWEGREAGRELTDNTEPP